MKVFVTGAAGFIGSNLTDRLLGLGHTVIGYDNFSTGRERFLEFAFSQPGFRLVPGDIAEPGLMASVMSGCDAVVHLAANADVRFGLAHPRKDFEQNALGTLNVLEAMREAGVRRIILASTGSVYGEPDLFPTPERAPFPVQTSLYAASKLAAEALVQAYGEGFGFHGAIFRFVSLLGERYTHGHVADFHAQLVAHPDHLDVLGDGKQRKSYLYVQDCVDAILLALSAHSSTVEIFNLGTDETCQVDDSIRWIAEAMGLAPTRRYAGGARGWVGDSPMIHLDCTAVRRLGWRPTLSIPHAILRTVRWLEENR